MPTEERVCYAIFGMILSVGALLSLTSSSPVLTHFLGAVAMGCIFVACVGRKGENRTVEYVGRASKTEACPACRMTGSLEIYKKKNEETVAKYSTSRAVLTTSVPMIRCMNNTHCSYERKYSLYIKSAKHLSRRQEFMGCMENAPADEPSTTGFTRVVEPAGNDNTAETTAGTLLSLDELAWEVADAHEELDRRKCLRGKKKERRGKMSEHPSTQRLQHQYPDIRCCPYCDNATIKLKRWIHSQQVGAFQLQHVAFSTYEICPPKALCKKTTTTGTYITRFNVALA